MPWVIRKGKSARFAGTYIIRSHSVADMDLGQLARRTVRVVAFALTPGPI